MKIRDVNISLIPRLIGRAYLFRVILISNKHSVSVKTKQNVHIFLSTPPASLNLRVVSSDVRRHANGHECTSHAYEVFIFVKTAFVYLRTTLFGLSVKMENMMEIAG